MKISYKFGWVSRKDDVHIDSCLVRFFEGDITTEDETDIYGQISPITKYRLINKIGETVYTDKDFGIISTDKELEEFTNKELLKDGVREPVEWQQ